MHQTPLYHEREKKEKNIGLVNPLHPKPSLRYLCCHHNVNKQQSKTNYSWTTGLDLQQQNYTFVLELLINILDWLLSDSYFAWHRGEKGSKSTNRSIYFHQLLHADPVLSILQEMSWLFQAKNFFLLPCPLFSPVI